MPVTSEQLDRFATDLGLCRGCPGRGDLYEEMRETDSVEETAAKWAGICEVAKNACQRAAQQASGELVTGAVPDKCPGLLVALTGPELTTPGEI